MLRHPISRILALYLSIAVTALSTPGHVWAMFVPSADPSHIRAEDMQRVRAVLESKAVGQRLVDLGLSPEEAMSRLSLLSDEQLHQLAVNLDSLQPGGDGVGAVIFLLLVAIVVVVVLQATGHEIVIKR